MIASREYVKDLISKVLKSIGFKKEFNKYSEEPHIIGAWLDNKPIYRKAIITNKGLTGKMLIGNIGPIDRIIDIRISILNSAGTEYFSTNADGNSDNVGVSVLKASGDIFVCPYSTWPSGQAVVIIEYTKN